MPRSAAASPSGRESPIEVTLLHELQRTAAKVAEQGDEKREFIELLESRADNNLREFMTFHCLRQGNIEAAWLAMRSHTAMLSDDVRTHLLIVCIMRSMPSSALIVTEIFNHIDVDALSDGTDVALLFSVAGDNERLRRRMRRAISECASTEYIKYNRLAHND